MEFIPQNYSANFVYDMGEKNEEGKKNFCLYANAFQQRGAKIVFRINDLPTNPFSYAEWDNVWRSISLKITRIPIADDDDIRYGEIASDWGSLIVGMILSLSNISPIEGVETLTGSAEGSKFTELVNRYERSPINRALCLEAKGYTCRVCGMNFPDKISMVNWGRNSFMFITQFLYQKWERSILLTP
ncbi:hypothetical protein ACRQV7_00765 [Caproiciproducens sp. R2]|uniref:hypothetical protein n=1 Tax=Caproiciproducens sp. R2 TaxID=3435187 RepID=UPI004034AD02